MTRHSLFYLDENATGSLQSQIRELLVAVILNRQLPGGRALPSGRTLAKQLGVGRNTVVIAYQQLVDEGYLTAHERSGYYVNTEIAKHHSNSPYKPFARNKTPAWVGQIKSTPSLLSHLNKPVNWRSYLYPFVYGQFDPSLFPIADWRECVRESVSISAIHEWAGDKFDRDVPELIHQIRTRLLPRRGIWANEDEILVTSGTQQALYLISQLLIDQTSIVGMEEPGYFDARNVLGLNKPRFIPLPVNHNGMKITEQLDTCDLIYTTPSHHSPTTATMPLNRRKLLIKKANKKNLVLIEDDYETENNFLNEPIPSLKSFDNENRVVYIGSLSKTLAPGLRLGYLVGPSEFIRQARALRRLIMRHMPANIQQVTALFIKRGHYNSLIHRSHNEFETRWQIMNQALGTHFGSNIKHRSTGGTSFWLQGPRWLDSEKLQKAAADNGILIESGSVFFMQQTNNNNYIRLGFSSIDKNKIEPGIKKLAQVFNKLKKSGS